MTESSIVQYLTTAFPGLDTAQGNGDHFFFYDPGGRVPKDQRFPFATLVSGDRYDQVSNLDRPGVFRLNVGVGKQTFLDLFGKTFAQDDASNYDFSALDVIMPHPVYGRMYWICVLNPSEATFEKVKPLLAEAYELAKQRHPAKQ